MQWDSEAADGLRRVPRFIRPLARRKVERLARERGADRVTAELLAEARSEVGPGGEGGETGRPDPAEIERLERRLRSEEPEKRSTRAYQVQVCAGAAGCPRSLIAVGEVADALVEGIEASGFPNFLIHGRKDQPILSHHRFQAAVSGCPNACSQPQICDFGVIGRAELEVNRELCVACGRCRDACQDKAVTVDEEAAAIDCQRCIGCGDCLRACPAEAISVVRPSYRVVAAGKLGRRPRLAIDLLTTADLGEVTDALERALSLLMERGKPGERLGALLDRDDRIESELPRRR